MQVKYINHASQMTSVNLKKSIVHDKTTRPRPLTFHERTEMVLDSEENVLQSELENFSHFHTVKQASH